ncbi:MAG: CDP-diacylglycerol--glycerol-3-phosphate 3-phosphatidyltransferase [Gammaproteobacteria bacterium]|nr:CDP-diacylglycerol--glycerol-3-phosphate 3-phosphatidyltransferase [Gammaproteobacteria bacterium]
MILNIPNVLTYLRIFLIPCFMYAFFSDFQGHHEVTAAIFLLAAATDWLDGFLARYLNQISRLGAFLDPVADKLIVAAALVLLVYKFPNAWVAIAGVVIVSREIIISALREWMAEVGARATIKVSFIGKIKTTAQLIAIFILLLLPPVMNKAVMAGIALMYVAVILTLWSMFLYLFAAARYLKP